MTDASGLSLSGRWTGIYGYAGRLDAHRFTVEIDDSGGLLTGLIDEPGDHGAPAALASLDGRCDGAGVRFTKRYLGPGEGLDPIVYAGALDGGGQEISGDWQIGAHARGPFVMQRDAPATAAQGVGAGAERVALR